MSTSSTLLIAGDCGPAHGPADGFPIEGYTANVRPALEQADFRFVNCMRTYSSRAVVTEHARQVNQDISMSAIFTSGLFDAVTLANNHSYDSGPDALVDTRELMLSKGVQVTGAGANLDEARQAAIIERNGVRVGRQAGQRSSPRQAGHRGCPRSHHLRTARPPRNGWRPHDGGRGRP